MKWNLGVLKIAFVYGLGLFLAQSNATQAAPQASDVACLTQFEAEKIKARLAQEQVLREAAKLPARLSSPEFTAAKAAIAEFRKKAQANEKLDWSSPFMKKFSERMRALIWSRKWRAEDARLSKLGLGLNILIDTVSKRAPTVSFIVSEGSGVLGALDFANIKRVIGTDEWGYSTLMDEVVNSMPAECQSVINRHNSAMDSRSITDKVVKPLSAPPAARDQGMDNVPAQSGDGASRAE